MSSEIPKKPSSGGNNVFIAMTVVMLLATGSLVVWRFTRSSSGPEQPTVPSTPTHDYERPSDNPLPPPPPPPPAEEPSSAPTASANANAPIRSAKTGCVGTCGGEATAALKAALAGRGGAGRRCYEKALAQNATLHGRMTVNVRVSPTGSVCSASVGNDDLHDPGLSNCILGVFRASSLPPPNQGCVDVAVPLNFVPNK